MTTGISKPPGRSKSASSLATLLTLAISAVALFPGGIASAASDPNAPSPASDQARVIAQGVSALPPGTAAWRLQKRTAPLPADGTFQSEALGFIVGDGDAILVTEETAGLQSRVAKGEAAYVPDNTSQRVVSLGDEIAPYIRFALVPADQAAAPLENGEIIFSGSGFETPEGQVDIDLVSSDLGTGSLRTTSSIGPIVVLATAGEVAVRFKGKSTTLTVGTAAEFGPGTILISDAGDQVGSFIAAVIGPVIPDVDQAIAQNTQPTNQGNQGTASVAVRTLNCPDGHSFPDQLDGADPECVDPVSDLTASLINNDTGETLNATTDGNGDAAFNGLAAGSYSLAVSPVDGSDKRVVCGSAQSGLIGNGDPMQLADGEQVQCTANFANGGAGGNAATNAGTGQLVATAVKCPDDMDFSGALTGIDPSCSGPYSGVNVSLSQLDGDTTASQQTTNDGTTEFSGLPPGTYQVTVEVTDDASTIAGVACVGPAGDVTGDIANVTAGTQVNCYINVSHQNS